MTSRKEAEVSSILKKDMTLSRCVNMNDKARGAVLNEMIEAQSP